MEAFHIFFFTQQQQPVLFVLQCTANTHYHKVNEDLLPCCTRLAPPLVWPKLSIPAKLDQCDRSHFNTDDGYNVSTPNLHIANSWNVLTLFLKSQFLCAYFSSFAETWVRTSSSPSQGKRSEEQQTLKTCEFATVTGNYLQSRASDLN